MDPYACRIYRTTRISSAPPVISRACREARSLALKTSQLYEFADAPQSSSIVPVAWVDRARDVLFTHWHPYGNYGGSEYKTQSLEYFYSIKTRIGIENLTVTDDLLDAIEGSKRSKLVRMLESCPSYSVCTAVVVIHVTDESPAIQSGLFGILGEERVVLVDAFDTKRLTEFKKFWQTYGTEKDLATKAFFDACVDGVPRVHYVETPEEYVTNLEIMWLLDNFHNNALYPDVKLLFHEIWLNSPLNFMRTANNPQPLDSVDDGDSSALRPILKQRYRPNRDHPWVKDVLSQLPQFCPTVMFRLCTLDSNDCQQSLALVTPPSDELFIRFD